MRLQRAAVALALAASLTACGDSDDEPEATSAAEETPSGSPTDETPSETPSETPTESNTDEGVVDFCVAVSIDDLAAETGWTAVESHGYVGEGSCEFVFEEAELSVSIDTYGQTIEDIRDQSANFEVVEVPDLGDEAFLQLATFEITPESVGMAVKEGDTLLLLGGVEQEESVTEDQLSDATEALGRLSVGVL